MSFADSGEGLLVLIPARNESRTIGPLVEHCRRLGADVWVLNDASTDGTKEAAEQAGARVLTFPQPQGKTALLRQALGQVPLTVPWVGFMDGDGQHDPVDWPRFWEARFQADLIMGDRWADCRQMPWSRRVVNRFMSGTLNFLAGGRAPDTQCGFRLARRAWLRDWQPQGRHFEFESEQYLQALRSGARVVSVPIRAIYAEEKSKIQVARDTWRFARLLLRWLGTKEEKSSRSSWWKIGGPFWHSPWFGRRMR
jgi:glycosyltransferase involved in cell wall biosynthesis